MRIQFVYNPYTIQKNCLHLDPVRSGVKKLLIHRFEMIAFGVQAAGSEVTDSPRPEWERCGEGGREKLYHVG